MAGKYKWLAAAVGVGLFAASAAPWTFSGAAIREEIARQVRDTSGLTLQSDGRVVFAILPRPRIKLANVVIRDAAGDLVIEADFLRGDLRLLPIMAGRLELAAATLVSPAISINLDANPLAREGALARAVTAFKADATIAAKAETERLGVLGVINGSAHLHSATSHLDAQISQIDMSVDWRRLNAPAGVQGTFQLDGGKAELAAWLARPMELARGGKTELSMRLSSPSLNFELNGVVNSDPHIEYSGNLSASTPDLRAVAGGIARGLALPGRLQSVSIKSEARIRSHSLELSDLRLSMDRNAYEGVLMFDGEREHSLLSGTLAADVMDFAPLLADAPAIMDEDRRWSRTRFPAQQFAPVDIDLRLSAARARIARTQLRDAGFSLMFAAGRTEFSLAEAKGFGGSLKGRISTQRGERGYDLAGQLSLAGVDAGAFLAETLHSQRINGELNGEISLAGQGESVARLFRSLNGEARMSVKSGDLAGLDLEQALRRLEKRPLSIASEVRSGRTSFTLATLDARIQDGTASIRQARAAGPGVEFVVTGAASIPDRTLDMRLQANQTGVDSQQSDRGPWLAMDIAGDWDGPALTLDARSLINRSEAAAPLLRNQSGGAAPASATTAPP